MRAQLLMVQEVMRVQVTCTCERLALAPPLQRRTCHTHHAPSAPQPRPQRRILIASIMEEYNRGAWEELVARCVAAGVDAFEINFSCPHGMPERCMGMAMGQNPDMVKEVGAEGLEDRAPRGCGKVREAVWRGCQHASHALQSFGIASCRPTLAPSNPLQVSGWVRAATDLPIWAKMTPNITDIAVPARAALSAGSHGIAAINTLQSVMGINLDTLRPEPCVEGYSTPGGYSSKAVKPIALAKCMAVSRLIGAEFDGQRSLSGIGGVERGGDAAEFILLGASTVQVLLAHHCMTPLPPSLQPYNSHPQVCTGVMLHGYPLVKHLCGGLQRFMQQHDFTSLEDFRGASLPYFTTHSELVRMQRAAVAAKKAKAGLDNDAAWTGDGFVKETESMVSN